MKLISEETRIQQINALPNISFVRWKDGYKDVKSKAICRCDADGFEWSTRVHNLLIMGHRCPQCAGKRRWTSQEREQQINDKPNITFVRWVGAYKNNKSKAVCRCETDGFEWTASISGLLNHNSGCPQCAGQRCWASEEREEQINCLQNISFVRWADGGYENSRSKVVCRCDIDGFEWQANAANLIRGNAACPQCRVGKNNRRIPADKRAAQINAMPNVSFVRWESEYKNSNSKAVCKCAIDGHEWAVRISGLINGGKGCPKCAKHGYTRCKPGHLYVLRSECGAMVKIGISNNYKRRHIELRRATPFAWSCIELIRSDDGAFIAKAEKELHSLTEQAQFSEPFDGYTEWRKWDDRIPMLIEEYRARA